MLVLIAVMGIVPQPFLEPAKPAVDRLIARFESADQRLRAADPGRPPSVGTQRVGLAAGAALPSPTGLLAPPAPHVKTP
jgi:NADH-quinone oxidoreductase subunit M